MDDYHKPLLCLILLVVVVFSVSAQRTPENGSQSLSTLFVSGIGAPYYEINRELIDCLIKYESRGDNEAIGKAGEIGILQFLPSTFQSECVEKLGYTDNIMNEEITKECAGEMIYKGGLSHWTTRKLCQKEPRNIFAKNAVEE